MLTEARDSIESKAAILTCESLEQEMRVVADEGEVPYLMRVFSSQCHRHPIRLAQLIEESMELLDKDMSVFIAYGECLAPIRNGTRRVHQIRGANCAATLLGERAEYEKRAAGSYFLTPFLALNWRKYFLGGNEKDPISAKVRHRLSQWFTPIQRVIMIDTGTDAAQAAIAYAEEFSELIGKPLTLAKGSLDYLRKAYGDFLLRR